MAKCVADGCDRLVVHKKARMCHRCYERDRTGGGPRPRRIGKDPAFGFKVRKTSGVCIVADCGRPLFSLKFKLCLRCYTRLKKRNRMGLEGVGCVRRQGIDWTKKRAGVGRALKKLRANRRRLILAAYGAMCRCCGEQEERFLTIDHIRGGGRKDARSRGGSLAMYKRIIEAGFPRDIFRILCMNCNWATSGGQTCPHQNVLLRLA